MSDGGGRYSGGVQRVRAVDTGPLGRLHTLATDTLAPDWTGCWWLSYRAGHGAGGPADHEGHLLRLELDVPPGARLSRGWERGNGGSEGTVGGGGRWEGGEGSGVLNENIPHWAPQKALTAAHAASRAGGQRPVLYSAGHRARARRQGCPRPTTDPGPPTTGSLAARNTLIPMKCFRGWFALVISTCLGCRGRVVPSMV